MGELTAGDHVLSGADSIARVVLTQHRLHGVGAPMLTIWHSNGSLTLTPDHVLLINGVFVPAREAKAGAALGAHGVAVHHVLESSARIVNPITTTGRILAADPMSTAPVLAATHPEWIAFHMLALGSTGSFALTLFGWLSYVLPATAQVEVEVQNLRSA